MVSITIPFMTIAATWNRIWGILLRPLEEFQSPLLYLMTLLRLYLFEPKLYADQPMDHSATNGDTGLQQQQQGGGGTDDALSQPPLIESTIVFVPCVLFLGLILHSIKRFILTYVFGKLNSREERSISDMWMNFIAFRLIILFGVINLSSYASTFMWLSWFGNLGLLHMVALLGGMRFKLLAISPSVTRLDWLRMGIVVTGLLTGTWLLLNGGLSNCFRLADIPLSSIAQSSSASSSKSHYSLLSLLQSSALDEELMEYDLLDIVAFLVTECFLIFCSTFHLIGSISLQAYDRWCTAVGSGNVGTRASCIYYLDFLHVSVHRLVETVHYLHIVLWSRVFSLASVVALGSMRSSFLALISVLRRHGNYRRLNRYIDEHFELHHLYDDIQEVSYTLCYNLYFDVLAAPC